MDSSAAGAGPGISISRARDVVSVVPYLIGYHPDDALVALGLRDGGKVGLVLCTRPPLPEPRDFARRILRSLGADGCRSALIVGYGEAARLTPRVDAVRAAAAEAGVDLRDVLRVADGRYWSYVCTSPHCCPPEGTPFDPSESAAAAEAVAFGFSTWPDRASIMAALDPVIGRERAEMDRATTRAEARCARMWSTADTGGHADFGTAFRTEGLRAVSGAVRGARGARPPDDPVSIAWLALSLVSFEVRDEAWSSILRTEADVHVDLWRRVLRMCDPAYAAAPGSLLAFAAWLRGDVALADAALDRVTDSVPAYSMAALIRRALDSGARPGAWHPPPSAWPC